MSKGEKSPNAGKTKPEVLTFETPAIAVNSRHHQNPETPKPKLHPKTLNP